MFVTTAAISHQIKEMEQQLGVALFARTGRSVQITPEGEIMHQAVLESIAALERGILKLRAQRNPDLVRVSAAPSLAAKWLVPRLEHFLQDFPAADVRVDVSFSEAGIEQEDVDLSIRYGDIKYSHANDQADVLFVETIFPVCSPHLLKQSAGLSDPRDLLKYKLIHVDWASPDASWPGWRSWMQAAGMGEVDLPGGVHFKQTSLALGAAMAGQGIALGEASLVVDDLAQGRLIKPYGANYSMQAEWACYLVARPDALSVPMVRAFRQWLLREARSMPQPVESPSP